MIRASRNRGIQSKLRRRRRISSQPPTLHTERYPLNTVGKSGHQGGLFQSVRSSERERRSTTTDGLTLGRLCDEKTPSTIRNHSRDRGVPVSSNSRSPSPRFTPSPRASTCPPCATPPSPWPFSSRAPASTAGTSLRPPRPPPRWLPRLPPLRRRRTPTTFLTRSGRSFLSLRGRPRPPSRTNSSRVARRAATSRGTPCACAVEPTPTRAGRSVPPRSQAPPSTPPRRRRRPGRARATRNRRTSACARASRGGEEARRVISGGDRRAARTASRTPPRVSRRVPGCDPREASVTTSREGDAKGERGQTRGQTREHGSFYACDFTARGLGFPRSLLARARAYGRTPPSCSSTVPWSTVRAPRRLGRRARPTPRGCSFGSTAR